MIRRPSWSTPILCVPLALALFPAATAQTEQKPSIDWQMGPILADLGGFAELKVPDGFLFTDKKGCQKLLELTHNIPSGNEVGALIPAPKEGEDPWFVIYEFQEVGFVKDDEKNAIDADALLQSLQKGTEAANEARKERGWPAFHLTGWEKPPYYDPRTNNLTWATRLRSEAEGESVNHSVRILGRRGTMNVDLVLGPERYAAAVPAFEQLMGTFAFHEGHRYADFIKGDKVAAYGLTALIAGGAGAVAVKTGLLAKFWKVILAVVLAAKKAIVVAIAALAAFFRKLRDWLTGAKRKRKETDEPSPGAGLGPEARADGASPGPTG